MTKQTKILLGISGVGVLAYLLWKNSKKTETTTTTTTTITNSIPKSQADCPKGKVFSQPECKQAPCPASCVDDGITYVQDRVRPKEDGSYGYDAYPYSGGYSVESGMVKCPNNPNRFYNPNNIYGTDPCFSYT